MSMDIDVQTLQFNEDLCGTRTIKPDVLIRRLTVK